MLRQVNDLSETEQLPTQCSRSLSYDWGSITLASFAPEVLNLIVVHVMVAVIIINMLNVIRLLLLNIDHVIVQ